MHAVHPQEIEQRRVTGRLDHHTVSSLEQGAHDQIKRMAGAAGTQQLRTAGLDTEQFQALGDLLAQRWKPQGRAVVEQAGHVGARHLAQRIAEVVRLAPALRQATGTKLQATCCIAHGIAPGKPALEWRQFVLCAGCRWRGGDNETGALA
ncbi:hypothetical protein D3C81_1346010 [compost metagenome]